MKFSATEPTTIKKNSRGKTFDWELNKVFHCVSAIRPRVDEHTLDREPAAPWEKEE